MTTPLKQSKKTASILPDDHQFKSVSIYTNNRVRRFLEVEAKREGKSVSRLIDFMSRHHLRESGYKI